MVLSVFTWKYVSGLSGLVSNLRSTTLFAAATLLMSCMASIVSAATDSKRGITVDDLLAIRDIKTMVVSPDGNYVAYEVLQADKYRNDYNISWYVVATKPDVEPTMVAGSGEAALNVGRSGRKAGDIAFSEIVWSPDSEWVYFTKRHAGEVQIWRSHRSGYGHEQVTNNAADVEGLKFSEDGSQLFFAVGRTRADIKAIFEDEALKGHLVQEPAIYTVEEGPYIPHCSDGQKRWSQEINTNRACNLTVWVIDLPINVERKAIVDESNEYFSVADSSLQASMRRGQLKGQSRRMETASLDGKKLTWFENENPAVFKGIMPPMWVAVFDGETTLRCSVKVCRSVRPQKIWWSLDGKEVIFLMRDGPRETLNSLYGWTPGETNVRTILSNDDMFYGCDMIGNRLVCGHESWTSPRKIVSVDLKSGEITTIADMNPEFQDFSFTRVEKIIGEDAYGNKAHAHLVYPKDYDEGQRYPLVIVQYRSRGFLRGGVGDEQPIHALAQNGLAVLSFDMPGLDEHFAKDDNILELNKNDFKYHVVDRGPALAINYMIEGLVERGIVDAKQVGITGLSAGMTTLSSALLIRNYAAASAAGIGAPPPSFEDPPFSLVRKIRDHAFGGTPFSLVGFETQAKYSIGMNARRIDTPFLVQVADREYYWSRQNYHALKDAGKPVEMIIYSDEHHVKWQPIHRYMVYNRNIDWFNFWLRGVEDDDPEKANQYERWRGLRTQHHANLRTLLSER